MSGPERQPTQFPIPIAQFTRRQFLRTAALATGAVAFTGCAASTSQFDEQSRVLSPEELVSGYENWYATTCSECGGGCGVIVRVVEGRAKKVEGNPDDPISQGKLCVRGQAAVQRLYNPDRVPGPRQLTGQRGSGSFGSTSWDAGLELLLGRLKAAAGKPGAVVLITRPLRATQAQVVQRFTQASGARWLMLDTVNEAPLKAAVKQVFGQDQLPEWDIQNAAYILNFGCDFLMTGPSPVHYGVQYGVFRQGGYAANNFSPQGRPRGHLTQVEPAMSYTGANADEWLPVRPGMEGVLALSIAQAAIEAGLASGAALGGGSLAAYSPDTVASQTGVAADRIRSVARDFMTKKPSLAIAGGQAGAHTNGTDNLSAALALNLLAGSVGQKGGVLFNPASPLSGLPAAGQPAKLTDWASLVQQLQAGQVQVLLVHDADPLFELPAALGFQEAIGKAGFIASFSSLPDDTSALADLVLPSNTQFEDWGVDVPEAEPGYSVVHFQQPVVQPFFDTRSFYDLLLTLGTELGGAVHAALPWATFKDAVIATARDVQQLNRGSLTNANFDQFWVQLRQRGGWWDTGIGNSELGSGNPGLNFGTLTAAQFAGAASEYPYFLRVEPSNSLGTGQGASLPWLQAAPDPITTGVWGTWLIIASKLGYQLGLREGDVVRVDSPQGSVELPVYISYAAPPDIVTIPLGNGHQQSGRYAKGRGVNPLDLLAPLADATTGALAYGATRVRLTKTGKTATVAKFEGTVPAYQIPGNEVAETVYGGH